VFVVRDGVENLCAASQGTIVLIGAPSTRGLDDDPTV
jgi:hypothetical protein